MSLRPILLTALAIAMVVVFPHWAPLPFFGYTIPVLLFAWFVLRSSGETFADVGFRLRSCSRKAALTGALAAVAILATMQLLVFPVIESFVELESKDIGLDDFANAGPAQLAIMIALAWLVGGLYEELVFHGFLFTRIEKLLPAKLATAGAFVATCALFGAYHLQMGTAGAFNALVVGVVYQALYLKFDRNLCASIVCHGVYNTVVLTLMYLGHL